MNVAVTAFEPVTRPVPAGLEQVLFLYINLDRSPERRADIERQLQALGVNASRVVGVDGVAVWPQVSEQTKQRFRSCHGRELRPGEVGCYDSHLRAMDLFLASSFSHAIILEDDALIPDTPDVLQKLFAQGAAQSWDFLRLHSRRDYLSLPVQALDATYGLHVNLTRSTGATAYALNRQAAQSLRQSLAQIEVPYDHAFDRPHHFGLKYRHLKPDLFHVAGHPSTIETAPSVKQPALRKVPTLFWRMRSETGRFIWSVVNYLRYRQA